MLTSKERKLLESKANALEPIFQIGKGGVTENLVKSVAEALKSRELVKLHVLNNAEAEPRAILTELAEKTASEPVAVRGGKLILYKLSDKDGIKHVL
ncbi:MAG: YhbY family RNA-binding protein [Clostridiales bacterium]|jgi:RNA-binding protein|nr:YhbY family RNA-binding protein [Clostridiales bacterium]